MKTLSLVLTAALSTFGLVACGDDTGGGTTGSGGSGGGNTSGNGGDNSSPSSSGSNNPSSTSGSNNTSSSNGAGGEADASSSTGEGGFGEGGGAEFICDDGEALPADSECDGTPDCADESDESPVNPNCPVFTCGDGTDIPTDYECDGFPDCLDESDEAPINPSCEGRLPAEWICAPEYYGGDICDCGCGAIDPDCAGANVESCERCEDPSCADDGAGFCDLSLLFPGDNSQCL